MKISMRDILTRKLNQAKFGIKYKYMNHLQIACLIASEELDIPVNKLYAFKCHEGCLFIDVEII